MFSLPVLNAEKTQKIRPKLTLGYVQQNSFQFSTPAMPLALVYGMSPPYGLSKEEMSESDVYTASFHVEDKQQLDFLSQLDSLIAAECKTLFGGKATCKSVLHEGVLKAKAPQNLPVVNIDKEPIDIGELRPGDVVVPIFKVSSLWSTGGEYGACIKVCKMMLIKHGEGVQDVEYEFCF